jgi:hypothetical protein
MRKMLETFLISPEEKARLIFERLSVVPVVFAW